jgi:hypothetical protein
MPRWTLAGAATSGTRRYTADEGSLFVLPDHAWVYANGPAAVRLGDALARDSRAPPISNLEPGAVFAQQLSRDSSDWIQGLQMLVSFIGADLITGRVTATFAAPPGAPVPALVRWLLPDADHATAGAADARRLVAAMGAAAAQRVIAAEGASIAMRFTLPYDEVTRYARG